MPPFQAPDERNHFAYVQSLSERGHLPGDPVRRAVSTEQERASRAANAEQAPILVGRARDGADTARALVARPEWSDAAYERWRLADEALPESARRDTGGPVSSASNPPLYYLYDALAYASASAGDLFDRLALMRLWSVVLLLVTTAGAWLLAGELFGRERLLQLVAAAVAGLQPMVVFISSSVTPDAMLFALWSLSFWLGARILKRVLTVRDAGALLGLVGLAIVTKATSYALLPAAVFVLAVAAVRARSNRRPTATALAVAAVALAVPLGTWLAIAATGDRPVVNEVTTQDGPTLTSFSARDFGSYLWQFYLPRLPFQERFGGMPQLPVYNIWHKQGWAAFGWLETKFPPAVYVVLALFSVGSMLGAGAYAHRRRRRVDLAIAGFFAIAACALLAGLHWTEFRTLTGGSGPFNQGRYLLPLIALGGAAVAATVGLLPRRGRPYGAAAVLSGLFALQLCSLGLVAARFYA